MKKITILLFAFISQISFAQNVFKAQKEIYLAQYYNADKNLKESLQHYLKAFELNPKSDSNNYLKASSIAFSLKKDKVAKKLLIKSIIQEEAPLDFINEFKELQPYKNTEEFKDVISKYDIYRDEYYRNMKHPYAYFKIKELVAIDQFIRKDDEVFKKMESKTDSTNISELIKLNKKFGYEQRGWLVIWHHRGTYDENNFVWKFYKPFFEQEIAKDNIDKSIIVDFEEFQNSFTSIVKQEKMKGALYTMQTLGNLGQTEYFDIKNLDKRRKSVGLPPLYFDHLIYQVPLPEDYKYKKENLLKDLKNL